MDGGWLTIKTKVDNDKFDKQIKDLENRIKKEEDKKIILNAKIQLKTNDLDDVRQKYKQLTKDHKELVKLQDMPYKTVGQMSRMKELENQYGSVEKLNEQIERTYSKLEKAKIKVQETKAQYDGINKKVTDYKSKIDSINLQKQQAEVSKFKDNFNGIGNSIQSVISKVTKLALGVFGIRTALSFVRRASSDLANYNPQYATNLEYIRYALTQMIAPVLEYILNLAKTILAYINYIANAWFGVNLFANASAKSFSKVKQNLGGATKQAKELQKTLAGFDEMNILNSNSTGGGGGAGGGALTPDFDLSDLEEVEIPDWIKWIAENKDIVIGAIMGIVGAMMIFKAIQVAKILGDTAGGFGLLKNTLVGLGIAGIIFGIVKMVMSVIDYMKDPTWNNFVGILYGLEAVIGGVAIAMIGLNASNPLGWIILALDAVALLVTWFQDLVKVETDEERKTRQVRDAEDELREARKKLSDATSDYIDAVEGAEDAEKNLKKVQDDTGISIDDLLTKMDEENLTYKDLDENQRKVYKAYVNNKNAQEKLKDSTDKLKTAQDLEEEKLNTLIGVYQATSDNLDDYKEKVVNAYKEGKISAKDATDAISSVLADLDEDTRKKFTENLPDAIKNGLDPSKYRDIANRFTEFWEKQIGKVENRLDTGMSDAVRKAMSKMGNLKVNVEGTSYGDSVGGYVTKMASGGLVNMPNRGVPLSNVRAGESGAEGIIPLTDQQAMAQLGAEIGRNVLVNLTNITSMNGRVISRELKTIQSEEDFAFNT